MYTHHVPDTEKIEIKCTACGHPFQTKVRGRGATCPECHKQTYVRHDGTTKDDGPRSRTFPGQSAPRKTGVEKRGYQTPDDNNGKQRKSQPGKGKPAEPATQPPNEPTGGNPPQPPAIVQQPDSNGGHDDGNTKSRKRFRLGFGNPYGGLFGWDDDTPTRTRRNR